MAMYICENCGCLENTALGNWWIRDKNEQMSVNPKTNLPFTIDMPLCSACTPSTYANGDTVMFDRKKNRSKFGQWHNVFKQRLWDGNSRVENPMDYSDYIKKFGGNLDDINRSNEDICSQ